MGQPLQPETLLSYYDDLQRKLAEYVGYLHKPVLQKYQQRHQIIPAFENDELCGYVLFNDTPGTKLKNAMPATLRIYQAAIQYDAQRIKHGTALVDQVLARARRRGFYFVDAFVTDTIPANDFWKAIGFHLIGTRKGGKKRKRTLNHYRMRIPANPPTTTLPQLRTLILNPQPLATRPGTALTLRRTKLP
jgi:ribosomal protein S18 acetylase RimI-like enzyme